MTSFVIVIVRSSGCFGSCAVEVNLRANTKVEFGVPSI